MPRYRCKYKGHLFEGYPPVSDGISVPDTDEAVCPKCGSWAVEIETRQRRRDAVPLRPTRATPDYARRAEAAFERGAYEDALTNYDRAVESAPYDAHLLVDRARTRYSLGDRQGTLNDCIRAIEVQPSLTSAYFWRAFVRKDLRDYQGAIADFERYLEEKPEDYKIRDLLGHCRYFLGDYEGAVADFEKAMAIEPAYPLPYYHRGHVHRKLDDVPGATNDFTRALELDAVSPRPWITDDLKAVIAELRTRQPRDLEMAKAVAAPKKPWWRLW